VNVSNIVIEQRLRTRGITATLAGVVAVDVAMVVVYFDLPKALIVLFSALSGAGAIISGALLLFGQISLDSLRNGVVADLIRGTWIWFVAFLILALIGVIVQSRASRGYTHDRRTPQAPRRAPQTPAPAPQTASGA